MEETLSVLSAFPERLEAALDALTRDELHRAEREGKWSIAGVVAHLSDLELVYAVRIRTIVSGAAGETALPALAQDAWVEHVHPGDSVAELLEQFRFDRKRNVAFVSKLGPDALGRSGKHPDYGQITVPMALERMINHDAKHLRQIERIRAAIRG
jgi:hypothetical protein